MPDAGTTPTVYVAAPKLLVQGQEQPALAEMLQELVVEETAEGLGRCEATFLNWGPKGGGNDFQFFDGQIIDFGKVLHVELGSGAGAGRIFLGKITGVEARYLRERPPEILVLAEDRLQDLRMTRRTRTFENLTDADLFQRVASDHSLQASVDVNGPTHRVLAQLNQSDLAFLRERARAVDAELWIDADTLNVKARSRRSQGDVPLTLREGLLEFAVLADVTNQCTGFTVSGWDVAGKEGISHRAVDSVLGSELNGDRSGSSILQSSFGQRDQQTVHDMPMTAQEAQAVAEGAFRRVARRFLSGSGLAEADARIRVGATVNLKELGSPFNGKYYVSRVRHSFDRMRNRGAQTAFWVERAGIGRG